jgi:hypothetical protein
MKALRAAGRPAYTMVMPKAAAPGVSTPLFHAKNTQNPSHNGRIKCGNARSPTQRFAIPSTAAPRWSDTASRSSASAMPATACRGTRQLRPRYDQTLCVLRVGHGMAHDT